MKKSGVIDVPEEDDNKAEDDGSYSQISVQDESDEEVKQDKEGSQGQILLDDQSQTQNNDETKLNSGKQTSILPALNASGKTSLNTAPMA